MALQAKQLQQSEEQKAAREARKRKSDIESLQQRKKLKMEEAKAAAAEIDIKIAELKSKKWLMNTVSLFCQTIDNVDNDIESVNVT